MKCPVDNATLNPFTIKVGKASISSQKCPTCTGLWIERPSFQKLMRNLIFRQNPEYSNTLQSHRHTQQNTKRPWEEKTKKCPKDATPMNNVAYAGDSHVNIDVCATCRGIWLDTNELSRLSDYARPHFIAETLGRAMIHDKREQQNEIAEFANAVMSPATFIWYVFKFFTQGLSGIFMHRPYKQRQQHQAPDHNQSP